MSDDMVHINTGASLSAISGAEVRETVKIPRAEWDAMTRAERMERLDHIQATTLANEVTAWAYVEDGQEG